MNLRSSLPTCIITNEPFVGAGKGAPGGDLSRQCDVVTALSGGQAAGLIRARNCTGWSVDLGGLSSRFRNQRAWQKTRYMMSSRTG